MALAGPRHVNGLDLFGPHSSELKAPAHLNGLQPVNQYRTTPLLIQGLGETAFRDKSLHSVSLRLEKCTLTQAADAAREQRTHKCPPNGGCAFCR